MALPTEARSSGWNLHEDENAGIGINLYTNKNLQFPTTGIIQMRPWEFFKQIHNYSFKEKVKSSYEECNALGLHSMKRSTYLRKTALGKNMTFGEKCLDNNKKEQCWK